MSQASFPHEGLRSGSSFPPPGPHGLSSPTSAVLRAAPTSHLPSGRLLMIVDRPYHGMPRVRSLAHRAWARGARRLRVRLSGPLDPWRKWDLPGSWRTPLCTCPARGPRRVPSARPSSTLGCCLPSYQGRRHSRRQTYRGSVTRPMHSLSTLRSAGCPDTTQDSLPAAGLLCRAGLDTNAGYQRQCQPPTGTVSPLALEDV